MDYATLEATLVACLSGDNARRGQAEAALGKLQKQLQSPLALFQVMQTSQSQEVGAGLLLRCTVFLVPADPFIVCRHARWQQPSSRSASGGISGGCPRQ